MNKKSKKTTVKEVAKKDIVIEPESILTEKEVKELKEDEIIDVVISEVEPIKEEPKKETKVSKEKTLCRIVLATPTYYVINKNGVTITVNEKNNYRRGEEIVR